MFSVGVTHQKLTLLTTEAPSKEDAASLAAPGVLVRHQGTQGSDHSWEGRGEDTPF